MKRILLLGLLLFSVRIGWGQENIALKADLVSTSRVSPWEKLNTINDGFEPSSSSDKSNGAYGNWPKLADETENWDWVQYEWDSLYVIDKSAVYWWTDGGGIQIPDESYIHVRDIITGEWVEVKNHSGFVINTNEYSVVTFDPVLTNAIRYNMMSLTESTGILEWKVFGRIGEQKLYNSTVEIAPDLAPGISSVFKVTAVENDGLFRAGYEFKALVAVANKLTGSGWNDEIYSVNGQVITNEITEFTLSPTDANGEVTFEVVLPAVVDPTDGISITLQYNDGVVSLAENSYLAPARTSPILTADGSDNSVDHDIAISFPDNSIWRDDISSVMVNGSELNAARDYEIQSGLLILKPSAGNMALTTSGLKTITVQALGFEPAAVSQEILAGQADSKKTVVESLASLYKGVTTRIRIIAKDQFGNALAGYGLKYDIEVINNDAAINESYIVGLASVTADVSDLDVPVTNNLGQAFIDLTIPQDVNLNDGIKIQIKLEDGTLVNALGYIDASLTASLISGKKVGEIAVAGRLYTEVHSLFMAARNENNTVLNWYNLGFSGGGLHSEAGGNFGNFGMDVPMNERDTKYPSFDTIAKYPAVYFNGNNFIKSNYPAETDITASNSLTIEAWVYDENPVAGEAILGWQSETGSESSAPLAWPVGVVGSDQWRHIVVSCNGDVETWYLDGTEIKSGAREMKISEGHRLILGGASESTPAFDGYLLTVRVHKEFSTPEQISHNFNGGGMLGTTLRFNLDPSVVASEGYHYDTWSDKNPENYYYKDSEHFDQRVLMSRIDAMSEADRNAFYERVPGMFDLAEACYHNYSEVHALRMPIVSIIPQYRGDGIKYRIKIGTTDGANWMGWHGALGFGYAMQYPGYINPHEFVHGTQGQTGGGIQGNYWEVHANFPQTYLGIYQTVPSGIELRDQSLFEASGRSYYHGRLMFQHLAESPEYGPMFISKMWYDGLSNAYPWITFKVLDPDPSTSLGYEWARMVQKNITWDYIIHKPINPLDYYNPNLYRDDVKNSYEKLLSHGFILLENIIDNPGWYRAPKGKIPQQTGWNIVPLTIEGSQVTVELDGYIDSERGSAWYGGFVAVNDEGKSRYSDIIKNGETLVFDINSNEQELYFTVVAIPDNIMAIDMVGDVRKTEQDPFPYKVKFTGAEPYDKMAAYYKEKYKGVAGHAHSNGGGFVDNKATVSETAYVGPNAYVIGTSKVIDTTRIEDYAVIDNASVSGHAIVSGHAVVLPGAKIKNYARIRDFGRTDNTSTLSEYAKIAEHGILETGVTNSGFTTLKGIAIKYGENASGTAMMDHHFAKGQTITKGKWFTWSWGSGRNPGEINLDYDGLYFQMTFEKEHPYMAWDDFGITWGYLNNGAKAVVEAGQGKALSLNGVDQYVQLQNDVSDQIQMSLLFDVKWNGGSDEQAVFSFGNAAGNSVYFTPSDVNGKAALVMSFNGVEERIAGLTALPENQWVKIAVYFGDKGAKLFKDDEFIGENEDMFIKNLTVGAEKFYNFLGRNQTGTIFFNGMIDNVELYNTNNLIGTSNFFDKNEDASAFVKIYPNPVMQKVKIEVKSLENAKVAILDMNGKKVYESDFTSQIQLSRTDFGAAGYYSVIVNEGGRKHVGKVVIN